ncbi:hypothetical protein AaE_013511 [Aphanomyces astaci]|uniref:Uncharacterized protein n=1 Tax=Aphanomyces astaci TaxID=112090 RepID=A0A6A4ZA45_APHAT|nr:hypothetical protein AaE_013511 [Aphanomyces astaci]
MTKLSDSPPKPPAILMDDEVSETSIDNNDELKATSESDNDDVPPMIQMVPTTLTPQVPTEWADQDDSLYENPVDGNTESRAALSVAQTSPPARLAHVQPSTRQEENVCKAESSTVQSHLSTSGDGDGMYVQWRKQMDMAEAARHKVQADLTEYLASLATKQDDSGKAY